ncbi:hypothetical protein TNCV_1902981 [Trichonephila clavipes]|nr:hypothetical protein TNCV_1902981 [Trichonephila clavipes]
MHINIKSKVDRSNIQPNSNKKILWMPGHHATVTRRYHNPFEQPARSAVVVIVEPTVTINPQPVTAPYKTDAGYHLPHPLRIFWLYKWFADRIFVQRACYIT